MGGWITDEDMELAARDLTDLFNAMHEDDFPGPRPPAAQIQAVYHDLGIYMSIDPQKVYDEYQRIFKAALAIGTNYDAVAELRQSIRYLANWTGDAADEFKMQMDKMEKFCDDQQTWMLRGLMGVAATYTVAVQSRDSFHRLLLATEAACRKEMADSAKEDTKLQSALLFDIAGGILSGDPKKLLDSTLETFVEMGKDATERVIQGNDADEVVASYRREADWLNRQFGDALDRIRTDLGNQIHDADQPPGLVKPLPLICDVTSPDFRYENFENKVHDPGPIGPVVDDERNKYAEEKRQQQSAIDRRLNPPGMDGRAAI